MPNDVKRHAAPARAALLAAAGATYLAGSPAAFAHAVVGDGVFPATLTVDDPGVDDEFDSQFGHIKSPDENGDSMNVNTVLYEWDKTITQNFQFSVSSDHVSQNDPHGGSAKGWDNVTVGAKYMVYANAPHEILISVGLFTEIGGTGARFANSYSTFSPNVYFGKGFGDLPESHSYLWPLAFTAQLSPNVTTSSSDQGPNSLFWGLTLQYGIHYLQHEVKDLGLPQPLSNMYFVVEAPMSTCTAGACVGQTTGTMNPGVLWLSEWGQFGVEAQIPESRLTGNHVGVLLDAHLFLDDLFPNYIRKPLF